jgi:hypothetical protein
MTTKEKAIKIAINTFVSEFDDTEVETYNKLKSESWDNWSKVDYAEVWLPFESYSVQEVVHFIDDLIEEVERQFN